MRIALQGVNRQFLSANILPFELILKATNDKNLTKIFFCISNDFLFECHTEINSHIKLT